MQTPNQPDPREERQRPASIINIYHFHGTVEKVIHETRHDSAGNTSLQDGPPVKRKQPWLQYLYWGVGIVGVVVAAYVAFFKK